MKKFLVVFLSVLVFASVFVLGAAAEDVVRGDPTLLDAPSLRGITDYDYRLPRANAVDLATWLTDNGYTSSANAFTPSFIMVRATSGSSDSTFDSLYFDSAANQIKGIHNGSSQNFSSGTFLCSNDYDFYAWLINEVGLSASDIITQGNASIFNGVTGIGEAIFSVGGDLLTFVTSSWVTVIALVAFVLVLGFGVIRKLVKGV